jgi:TIR domain
MNKTWDIFISHASEDKEEIVRELAKILTTLKLKVWYDEFSLNIGDSLVASIDKGLINSKFGLVIISKNFLNKKWPDYEYKSLITKEVNGVNCILPIWHNITKEEIQGFSLYLADKVALNTSIYKLQQIALKVCQAVRPEIIADLKSYILFKEIIKNGQTKKVKISELKLQEKPRSKLSKALLIRAKIIHYGIGQHTNQNFEQEVYGYELDLKPEREI